MVLSRRSVPFSVGMGPAAAAQPEGQWHRCNRRSEHTDVASAVPFTWSAVSHPLRRPSEIMLSEQRGGESLQLLTAGIGPS